MNLNKSQAQTDSEIIHNITSLVELELKKNMDEDSFELYKLKTKQLLQKLLEKLEDNFEYQLFLESEVKRLETLNNPNDKQDYNKLITTCEIDVGMKFIEPKNNESPIQAVIKNIDYNIESIQKDQIIEDLKIQLRDSNYEIKNLNRLRKEESQIYTAICNAFTERIRILNNNFDNKSD